MRGDRPSVERECRDSVGQFVESAIEKSLSRRHTTSSVKLESAKGKNFFVEIVGN